jgi:hypothetical protein
MAHSRFGFSGRERYGRCAGSLRLSQDLPERLGGEDAREGTLWHALNDHCLKKRVNPLTFVGVELDYEFNGEKCRGAVTQEMAEHAKDSIDQVYAWMAKDRNARLYTEHKLHLPGIHPKLTSTLDCAVWLPSLRLLIIIDFKYGRGVFVPISIDGHPHKQVEGYGIGFLEMFPDIRPLEVQLTIIQPRYPHEDGTTRSVTLPILHFLDARADLVDEIARVEEADKAYGAPDVSPTNWETAYLRSGAWCRFCPAAATCPVLRAQAQELAKVAFTPDRHPDPNEIADWLDKIPAIEARIKSLREFAYGIAARGIAIPRHKLVEKWGNRAWKEGITAENIATATGLDLERVFEPRTIRTAAQVEKQIPKSEWKKIENFTTRKSNGTALVEDSDPRPAISKIDAAEAFFKIGKAIP